MSSIIKVDNIQDQCGSAVVTKCGASKTLTVTTAKANNYQAADGGNIINQCGTTITLGASGDNIVLASGATQSGFGRTGSVNWDTTAKTSSPVTAVSGNGYFIDTTGGGITVNLPAGNAGDIVAISDYANTAATNNITITPNGSEKIQGLNISYVIDFNGGTTTLVYVDGTQGWRLTDAARASDISQPPLFTVATGGTITTSGDYKIHTFTGPGTFTVTQLGNAPTIPTGGPNTVSYLVVAGGGNGGGGFREGRDITPSYTASPLVAPAGLTISQTAYPITVGGGGGANSSRGSNSVFSTITSTGGGASTPPSRPGGSGAGANNAPRGEGNTPPVSPPQGQPGGPNVNGQSNSGGGGATEGGQPNNGPNNPGGRGGAGATTSITGSPTAYAGGGGGSANAVLGFTAGAGSPCGTGGVGTGSGTTSVAGAVNTGGGAGTGSPEKSGGSGIVVIRYKYQ